MAFLLYHPDLHMGISEDPSFPLEGVAASIPYPDDPIQIKEYKTYFVKFYGNSVPDFFRNDDFVLREFPEALFEINFRNWVGLTRIGPIKIRVQNRKISDALYHSLLDYIAGKYANLVFSFGTPTGQSYKRTGSGRDIAYIEYLFLKKTLLDKSREPDIDAIACLITANPHHKIHREVRTNSIDAIRHTDPGMLMEIFTSPGEMVNLRPDHTLLSTSLGTVIHRKTGRPLYPARAREEWKCHSIDTNENRFIKFFLKEIQRRLEELDKSLGNDKNSYLNPDIKDNLSRLRKKVDVFLRATMWKEVGNLCLIPANSQVLQRRDGYRQLYRLYSFLQLATRCDFRLDFKNILETKDTATLFEYWCFFLVKDLLDQARKATSFETLVWRDPLKEKLIQGLRIDYEGGIDLRFNWRYGGSAGLQPNGIMDNYLANESYSHAFYPDIIISQGEWKLIFDAKYKGKRGGFYGEEEDGTISSCKDEDIDKMHTYREAIDKVSAAYILYPGMKEIIYPCHRAESSFEGVGALPLRPTLDGKPEQMHIENIRRVILNFINQ
jgi:predicted component of viral defense system (DUF524 family)